jgi:CelD/BcsL family acetyltransferase involved in cellulose biosynthesis
VSVYLLDPTTDARWSDFVTAHAGASIFHSREWLETLSRTYGYRPLVLTTSAPGSSLTGGLPVCELGSWAAKRLVSLPFSDHCDPLFDRDEDRREILTFLKHRLDTGFWKSVELRPRSATLAADRPPATFRPTQRYCLHRLDLTPALERLYQSFHSSCMRRAIRRAGRERLEYEAGGSPALLANFYTLLLATRRRHGVPPQPLVWFKNLMGAFGDRLTIRMVSKAGRPVAGMMTLSGNHTMVYKYGCSDASCHKWGGMPFLFWRAIQEAKGQGLEQLDLGRSNLDQPGLITFKNHLGAACSTLTYYGLPATRESRPRLRVQQAARWFFERLPDPALTFAGRVLYKHFGSSIS